MKIVRDAWQTFSLTDLLDVAIIAVLLCLILLWLRDRASRSLGVVVTAIAMIFLLARWLDLYLVTMVFHYGSVAILLALMIVFQQDIRHGFERLTSWTWSPGLWRPDAPSDRQSFGLAEIVAEAVCQMADHRVGALIVLPGRQPLERHLRGGVDVDAKASQPLLLSIFHPKSPGHDGAIIIQRERISRLGVHLPLTQQAAKLSEGGTRHAAAVGLAEVSDATILVVSEERGTISVAKDGELQRVEAESLVPLLIRSFQGAESANMARPGWLRRVSVPVLSVAGALLLWLMFAFETEMIQRTLVVPVEFRNLRDGWEIEEPKPTYAEVTLSGTESAFALLDATTATVSLDTEREGGRLRDYWRTEAHLKNIPESLEIESVLPEVVSVTIRRKSNDDSAGQP
ncbi:diadenylate cyclase [Stieleria sp. ICT_E10.1]|uniref:diadenylate cyclase n=1 Tax=Stieleria sedimenti TaxID=2976331 RepID=UPI00217FC108|nr:diadenylate cyclase [Stieleria sedimenti]MCS7471368.1 diadenylate cyclase [Stieleria sedimenti]